MNPSSVIGSVASEGGDVLPFGRKPGNVLCFRSAAAVAHEEKGSLRVEAGATVENARREKRRALFLRTHRSSVSVVAGRSGSGGLTCADYPRSLISRLLLSSIRKRPTGIINTREAKAMAAKAEELPPQPVATPVDGSDEIDAGKDNSSGKKTDELCLNLGMGFALSFLFTRSSSEINKMIELRKQMEILLEEIKLNPSPKRLESQNNQNYNSSKSETESKSARDFKNCRRKDIEMEEELVELVAESSQAYSEEKTLHCGVSAKELRARLNQLVQTRRQEGIVELETSFQCTDHEDSEYGEVTTNGKVFAGVSAPELERKLHELLDSRQNERIMALEWALERAKLKINEKEKEACRWRYNARLISER
ncbi:protein POLAR LOCALIZATION DURING ASYMMETRIC DIVISION AND REDISTRIBUTION-like [Zingiber officinale]|uniref:Uncharacterized protein n=1 Tax=Zingiber officinale TaxID=94328 RepID=A0A8J5LLM2_ZINOF|nr:protein POLAR LOCALIZATION DURING ASYMMETRIC DIVISION AND REDISTRIBUTION-like [Zingiber officinale]KAG6524492.1 hypothetical protein ZIOFF_014404 [Zingiber officinale]